MKPIIAAVVFFCIFLNQSISYSADSIQLYPRDYCSTEETYNISLESGYNLIILPIIPQDANIELILSPIITKVKNVWEFNPSDVDAPWKHYRPGSEHYSDLTQMTSGKAYWIEVSSDIILQVTGDLVSEDTFIDLKQNLDTIGWPYQNAENIATALSDSTIVTGCNQVLKFDSITDVAKDKCENLTKLDKVNFTEPDKVSFTEDKKLPVINQAEQNNSTDEHVTLPYIVSESDDADVSEDIEIVGDDSFYMQEGTSSVASMAGDMFRDSATPDKVDFIIDETSNLSGDSLVSAPEVMLQGIVDSPGFSETETLTEGISTLLKQVVDKTENVSSESILVIPDTQAPVITLMQPDTPTNDDVILTYTVSDNLTITDNIAITGENSPYTDEGKYSVVLSAEDEAGNSTISNRVNFTIDKTPPVIIITSPQPNSVFIAPEVTLQGTIDGEPFSETRILTEGSNTLTKETTDTAGNTSSASITITLDTHAPVIMITNPSDNALVNTPEVTLQGTIEGEPFSETRILTEGLNTLTKETTDAAGNTSTESITVTLDTHAPVIMITNPSDNALVNTPEVTLQGTIDGEPFSETRTLTEGSNTLIKEASDIVGNTSTESITVTLDTHAPVITLKKPNTPTNDNVILVYTVSDNLTIAGNIAITGDNSPYINEGAYSVVLTAVDESENFAISNRVNFTIDKTPPVINITSPTDEALINTATIILQGTVDNVPFTESRNLSEGDNTVIKIAQDQAGNTASAFINVTLDTVPPEIIITSPQSNSVFINPDITIEGIIDGVFFSNLVTLENIGKNVITKEATDAAGNSASASVIAIYSPGELIGPEGGEVLSYDGKAKLIVPEGAVLEPTYISITSIDSDFFDEKFPQNYKSSIGVQCEPMGLILQKEAQLILKLDEEEVPGTELSLGLYSYGFDIVELLGQSSPVEKDGITVTFNLWHFSEYFGLKSMISQGAPIGSGVQVPLPNLLTGSYGYEVPIIVPPGRAKMQPAVSIKYNSSSSNSWVGYGWNLNPGYITCSTKSGIPSYDDNQDTFILVNGNSSSELVYLIDNLYQSRVESEFSKFYKEADDSWRVMQKDGTVLFFGTGLDSKESSIKGVFAWKLTQVMDNNGNTINFSYIKDEGKSYLSGISYNNGTHMIDFYLEDRNDIVSSYISGSKILMRKRLRRVEVSIGYDLAWRYELDYGYASETNRSLLKSVQRFTSDGKAFPVQEFNYQNHDEGLE